MARRRDGRIGRRTVTLRSAGAAGAVALVCASSARAAPPAYDHIVVVVEENESLGRVIGAPSVAPYINNTLVAGGVSFNNFFGITHPSQPNYLEMFSGSNQGNTNDSIPTGQPFITMNLAAALGAGNFVGYSETLPAPGDTVETAGKYARKHAPWVNWQGTGTNQLNGAAVSRPFFSATGAAFFGDLGASTSPAALDYTKLPKVTFVIPNLDSDMHDGAYPTNITTGDTWLQTNINAYAQWARTHNSLLVVTFDEDNSSGAQANKIPTIFYGANLKPGGTTVDATYTLHNLLRTVEDTYGATHSGAAAKVRAVHGAFAADVGTGTARLQQGNGYADAHDTMLQSDQPTTKGNALADLTVDTASTTGGVNQVLIRFDNLAAKVPAGAQILSAKLIVKATNTSANNTTLHRLTHAWTDNATWNDVDGNGVADAAGGVDLGGADAETNISFTLDAPYTGNMAIFDVTGSVEAWLAGAATNFGWALLPTGSDGFAFTSSEGTAADRPVLEIVYVPEPGTAAGVACAAAAASLRRRRRH